LPQKTCEDYVMDLKEEPNIYNIEDLIFKVNKFIKDKFNLPENNPQNLDENELFAVLIYTWDIRSDGFPESKFKDEFNFFIN